MDRILCRAYSLDSNISDLSGSIGVHRPRTATNKTTSPDDDENIFMSILNDCATLTGITEFVAEGQAALTGETDEKKSKRSGRNKHSQPNVWGVSPSIDDSSDDSAKQRKKLEEEDNIQHDNIELVLDDNFKTSGATAKSSKPKLKNRVSSALRLPSSGGETSPIKEDSGLPSALDENEGGKSSDPMPMNQVDIPIEASSATGSTTSSQKKSSRKLFRFPLNPAKKNAKKNKFSSLKSTTESSGATREQIEGAKNCKSTLDKKSGKVSKIKGTVWKKPAGYDEACKELAAKKDGSASNLWNAAVDPSTGKTYYYNKSTKEVSWTIPEGYSENAKKDMREDEQTRNDNETKAKGGDSDIDKHWRETVDPSSGKKYYYNKKTKMVSWEKPAGFIPASLKQVDEDAHVETLVPTEDTANTIPQDSPFDEEPPDAPFDEPGAPSSPKRAHFSEGKNLDETSDMTSLFSRTKSLKSIELTKQRTYASAMTDTTKKIANTGFPARDFTNTQINVIKDPDDEDISDNPLPKTSLLTPKLSSPPHEKKAPIVSPTSPRRRYQAKKAENLGSGDDSDSGKWSDEVSDLSGIGNELNAKPKKDSRMVRS